MRRLRALTAGHRTGATHWILDSLMPCHAGGVSAGGFVVSQRYISHMIGSLSIMAALSPITLDWRTRCALPIAVLLRALLPPLWGDGQKLRLYVSGRSV